MNEKGRLSPDDTTLDIVKTIDLIDRRGIDRFTFKQFKRFWIEDIKSAMPDHRTIKRRLFALTRLYRLEEDGNEWVILKWDDQYEEIALDVYLEMDLGRRKKDNTIDNSEVKKEFPVGSEGATFVKIIFYIRFLR